MRAAYASSIRADDPLSALTVGDLPEPSAPDGWVTVDVRASSLNHHEIWSLRGMGLPADRLPMILGCDATGVTPDGRKVVVHGVIRDPQDPRGFSLLSERHPGTLAERVAVPAENLVTKPAALSFADAACLPTAWLTAYRMLTRRARIDEAESVLVQGAGGGVATAAVVLAYSMGKRVYATSRDPAKRERIAALGATAVQTGARLPERVDVVIESVGAPTFEHSLKCCAPGARIVVCGATGGTTAKLDLPRLFMMQVEIHGSTMGTADELAALMDFLVERDIRPVVDAVYGFSQVADAFAHLYSGNVFGKIVLDHTR